MLELQDYAALPITADNTDANTRSQLARVNYLRDEPGGRRFFVNDLNGPLYILDKQTKTFTTYLDFNGLGGQPGLFPKFTYARNFATGLTNVILDPDYARNGVFYTLHMEDPSTPALAAAPRSGRRAWARSVGLHDDAGGADADGRRADRSRGRARRMDGSQYREHHVRRHGPRAPARAVSAGTASARRDDVQPGRRGPAIRTGG